MVLRAAVTALALGFAAGGWLVSLSNPSTSLSDAESAARIAFPDAGRVRETWIAFLMGDPPLALLGALTRVGAGVAGLVSRGSRLSTAAEPVVVPSTP